MSSLSKSVKSPFSVTSIIRIALDIALGLNYLYFSNVVHRDMNLGNFMVSKEGVVKFVDFGEGKELKEENAVSHTCDRGMLITEFFYAQKNRILDLFFVQEVCSTRPLKF